MRWLLLLVLAGACSKSGRQCRTEAEALVAFLRAGDMNAAPFEREGIALPLRGDLPARPLPNAEALHVGPHSEFPDEQLKGLYDRAAWHKRFDGRVYLVVDKRTPWDRVAAAFEGVTRAGFTKILFVFTGAPAKRPPPSKIDARFAAIRTREQPEYGTQLSAIFGDVIAGCASMRKPFHWGDPEKTRTENLLDALPTDLVDCGCNVDLPSLRTALWHLVNTAEPTYFIEVAATRDGTIVRGKPNEPWDLAGKRIDANTTNLWLAVE